MTLRQYFALGIIAILTVTYSEAQRHFPALHVEDHPQIDTVALVTLMAPAPQTSQRVGPAAIYPNQARNPGLRNPDITDGNFTDNICKKGWSTSVLRPPVSVTNKIKHDQMIEYGDTVHQTNAALEYDPQTKKINEAFCDVHSDNPKCFELDHIDSIENGGSPDSRENLWPESYNTKVNGKVMGARQKDGVENYVHNGICLDVPNAKFSTGPKPPESLTLQEALDILGGDWYACYQKFLKHQSCKQH